MATIQNNRQHQREQLLKRRRAEAAAGDGAFGGTSGGGGRANNHQRNGGRGGAGASAATNSRQGLLTAGFEYAVQKDGTVLAERRWRELRPNGRGRFKLYKPDAAVAAATTAATTSLGRIDQLVQTAARQYRQSQQSLPPEPAQKQPPVPFSARSSSTSVPSGKENLANSQDARPAATSNDAASIFRSNAVGAATATTSTASTTPASRPLPPTTTPGSHRKRNRHNAVYGGHLPDEFNYPGVSQKVFGGSGMASSAAIAGEERNRCRELLHKVSESSRSSNESNDSNTGSACNSNNTTTNNNMSTNFVAEADDLDDVLASIDVDAMVSQHLQQNQQGGGAGGRSNNSTDRAGYWQQQHHQQSFQNHTSYNNNNNNNNPSAGFDYGMSWNSTEDNNGGNASSSFDTSFHNNNDSYGSTYEAGSSSFGPNGGGSGGGTSSFYDDYGSTSYDNSSNAFASASAMDTSYNDNNFSGDGASAPLCPGHSVPCLVLTANTSANMGRQFYKCSLPEDERCDFFEWADGVSGSWNTENNTNGLGAVGDSYGPGDVKDVVRECERKFGHKRFRKGQKEVVSNALNGRDVFVLMPTGGGKSLCYQLPAWCTPGLTVIVSPLLSLIQDQVQSMKKLGVPAEFLSSGQDYDTEQRQIVSELNSMSGHHGIKLLYVTPEKLSHSNQLKGILRSLYNRNMISRFVVDEAHCISDWAHDFRPDYNALGILRRDFPAVPLMALTATANGKVVSDAIKNLGMRNPFKYSDSFNRPNLRYA